MNLSKAEVQRILDLSENYSGSDIKVLCKEAAMGPVFTIYISIINRFVRLLIWKV